MLSAPTMAVTGPNAINAYPKSIEMPNAPASISTLEHFSSIFVISCAACPKDSELHIS